MRFIFLAAILFDEGSAADTLGIYGRIFLSDGSYQWLEYTPAIASAVAAIFSALVAWRALTITEKQADLSHRQSLPQIQVSCECLDLATLNDIIRSEDFDGRTVPYRVLIKNNGRTPANNLFIDGFVSIDKYPTPQELSEPAPTYASDLRSLLRGYPQLCGDGSSATSILELGEQHRDQLHLLDDARRFVIYVSGYVSYIDYVGAEHMVKFRFFHNQESGPEGAYSFYSAHPMVHHLGNGEADQTAST